MDCKSLSFRAGVKRLLIKLLQPLSLSRSRAKSCYPSKPNMHSLSICTSTSNSLLTPAIMSSSIYPTSLMGLVNLTATSLHIVTTSSIPFFYLTALPRTSRSRKSTTPCISGGEMQLAGAFVLSTSFHCALPNSAVHGSRTPSLLVTFTSSLVSPKFMLFVVVKSF